MSNKFSVSVYYKMYILVSADKPNSADVIEVSKEIGKILNVVPNGDVVLDTFGLMLLKTKQNTVLASYKGEYASRCKGLLDYWSNVTGEGWNDVVMALKEVDELKGLATRLDKELKRLKQQLTHLEKSDTVQAYNYNEPEKGKFI